MHYVFDLWITKTQPQVSWSRFADDGLLHCKTEKQAQYMWMFIPSYCSQLSYYRYRTSLKQLKLLANFMAILL